MRELCYKARELLIEEGNVVCVDAPVTVRHDTAYAQLSSLIMLGRYAETSMANFMISWNYFEWVGMCRTLTTFLWVRLLFLSFIKCMLTQPRRLRGPWILQSRVIPPASMSQSPLSRSNNANTREPRITTDNHRLWLL